MRVNFIGSYLFLLKNIVFIFLLLLCTTFPFSLLAENNSSNPENDDINTDSVTVNYATPTNMDLLNSSKMPQFPGGMDELSNYLKSNIEYPDEARKNKEQGQVIIQFWIEETGSIKDITILKGISPQLDREAVRLINNMPEWIPAEREGKKMKMMHVLSINFRLDNISIPVSTQQAKKNN